MDKKLLVARLAKMTRGLSTVQHQDSGILNELKSELSNWIVRNYDNEEPGQLNIIKRTAYLVNHVDGSDAASWIQGRRSDKSLGPFVDPEGGLTWFDVFYKKELNTITFKGDSIAFLKFNNADFYTLATTREIHLSQGSIWIKSYYLSKEAPNDAFVGLRISGGSIHLSGESEINGSNIMLDSTAVCTINLKLEAAQTNPNFNLESGVDAGAMDIRTPDELHITFRLGAGSLTSISEGSMYVFDNEFRFTWVQKQARFDPIFKRILIPVNADKQQLHIGSLRSTLFNVSGITNVEQVFWQLPVTYGGNNELGESIGCGGYFITTGPGITAMWNNLDAMLSPLEAVWIFEPGKFELLFSSPGVTSAHYLLWHKTEKRCSATVKILKGYSVAYSCSAVNELETIIADANIKAYIDRPLSADGRRMDVTHTKGKCVYSQYKADKYFHCSFNKLLEKKLENGLFDELRPSSIALSNAYAKISPCDEFRLGGKIVNANELSEGNCVFRFGLYTLLPIFPDPYVSNITFEQKRIERFEHKTDFQNYLQVNISWKDIYDPLMSFAVPKSQSPLFAAIPSSRKKIYDQLQDRKPATYLFTSAENPVSTAIEQDREYESRMISEFVEVSGGRYFPDIFILDISGAEDQFGVGLSSRTLEGNSFEEGFAFEGIDLISKPENLSIVTLPPFQWEAISTIPNPNVLPKDFPSPAHSLDTGDPAVMRTATTYQLIPVVPTALLDDFIGSFGQHIAKSDQNGSAFLNLPFGLKSYLRLRNVYDHDKLEKEILAGDNRPFFQHMRLLGGRQLSLMVVKHDANTETESAGFEGAVIQTRNLIDKSGMATGLSVLGPFVDTIFNKEFRPGGANPRVPLQRIDISGYGATVFSSWRNPEAQIAATSQARFDVLVGRTAHEVIQVRSMLYCCGASVVRTITIQRNGSGGVTRHDSGWVATGPGLFDFSYKPTGSTAKVSSPFVFHLGSLKAYHNITNIRDSSRIVDIPSLTGEEPAKLQEVFFDADVIIDEAIKGRVNGYVSAKNQKGFVQLEPSGVPISAAQLTYLLKQEGSIGGPVDCTVNIGGSGQEMRVVRVDTNAQFGTTVFVNALRGSLVLPIEGNWRIVQQKANSIESVQEATGLPLIRYNSTPLKFQMSEPGDDPAHKIGLVHSSSSHRVLFPGPYIMLNDPHINSDQPAFADLYALADSNNIFPNPANTFPVGAGEGRLKILGSGILELVSTGKLAIAPIKREIYKEASFTTYVEYFDRNNNPSQGFVSINPLTNEKWSASISHFKQVYDIEQDPRVKLFHLSYYASGIQAAKLDKPAIEFGGSLKTVGDMLRMLNDDDLGEIGVDCHNIKTVFKYKMSYEAKIEFEVHPNGYEKKIHFWPAAHKEKNDQVPIGKFYGIPALLPPYVYFVAKLGILASHDEHGDYIGLKVGSTIGVQCANFFKVVAAYAVGIVEYKAKFGTSVKQPTSPLAADFPMALVKEHSFKIVLGCSFKINLAKIGEIEGMRGIGVEYNTTEKHVIAVLTQKAEIAIATCSVGVTIEAKAPVEKMVDAIDPTDPLKTIDKFVGAFELTLIIELSAAYVINFEYEYTWKELNNIC